jgi:hypothetical protein
MKSRADWITTSMAPTWISINTVVGLNKKKKLLTLDQNDLAGVVSSYTPFMTRKLYRPKGCRIDAVIYGG